MSLPRVYTDDEVAEYLGCPKRVVQDMARAGRIVGFKAGKYWRFTEDALLAYMNPPVDPVTRVAQATGLHPKAAARMLTERGGAFTSLKRRRGTAAEIRAARPSFD